MPARRPLIALALVVPALALTACGSSSGGASSSSSAAISVQKKAKVGNVLVGPSKRTLYHLTAEQGGKIACTGSCAKTWPPYTTAGAAPSASVSGTVGTVTRPDGAMQVTFNGQPLYYYAKDKGSADALGQGVDGVWFAVTGKAKSSSGSGNQGTRGAY